MKPWELLGETRTPDGRLLALTRRGGEYVIHADGKALMSSRMHGSEEALARLGCRGLARIERPSVLVGGLGMGYTLRATLDVLPSDATLVVAELIPAVAEWNRGALGALAGRPLDDRRVRLELADVAAVLRASPAAFDAVLLDVDNGPDSLVAEGNASLYDSAGLAASRACLRQGGVVAYWSVRDNPRFEKRLRAAGFTVQREHVRSRPGKRAFKHTVLLATA